MWCLLIPRPKKQSRKQEKRLDRRRIHGLCSSSSSSGLAHSLLSPLSHGLARPPRITLLDSQSSKAAAAIVRSPSLGKTEGEEENGKRGEILCVRRVV